MSLFLKIRKFLIVVSLSTQVSKRFLYIISYYNRAEFRWIVKL